MFIRYFNFQIIWAAIFANTIINYVKMIIMQISLPPIQAPKAKAHTRGCSGSFSSLFWAKAVTTLIIIVDRGTLSTNALANADTQSSSNIATANRDSSFTDRIIFSVCFPIQAIRPRRDNAWSVKSYNYSKYLLDIKIWGQR